eukprot:6216595-Ditylum_brightwellii.AAC.1
MVETSSYDRKEIYQPISRSYDGHSWECVAGNDVELQHECDMETCTVKLPSPKEGQKYTIARYEYSLSNMNEAARFLD